ncbi:MAG TPA: C40 family peptidase [Bacteroidales bacterium]|nr:C40 family peptidase [Bacteroidales bacterium]HOK97855.1 C40 family peptidase [Bacteroidales bacterium]HPO64620.1 C40 family peptidase [Bacteroidales bacterium]
MKALCAQTFIPIRAAASDTSEMVSQLLFGETCQVMAQTEKWVKVRCDFDGYEGWVFKPALTFLSEQEYLLLRQSPQSIVNIPILTAREAKNQHPIYLTAGCCIYNHEPNKRTFSFLDRQYSYEDNFSQSSNMDESAKIILETALRLINVPYLWGGRSTFGIDCSGLVQTCFRVVGIDLPRDARMQAMLGKPVNDFEDIRPSDLAFFKNADGIIIHVGILLSSSQIIHASNFVRISAFDERGILHDSGQDYTHQLAFVKRFL